MSSRFIECPSCGALQEDFDDKRIANNFCSECDYPIFFDTFDESQRDSEDASARNRSPGVEGEASKIGENALRAAKKMTGMLFIALDVGRFF